MVGLSTMPVGVVWPQTQLFPPRPSPWVSDSHFHTAEDTLVFLNASGGFEYAGIESAGDVGKPVHLLVVPAGHPFPEKGELPLPLSLNFWWTDAPFSTVNTTLFFHHADLLGREKSAVKDQYSVDGVFNGAEGGFCPAQHGRIRPFFIGPPWPLWLQRTSFAQAG